MSKISSSDPEIYDQNYFKMLQDISANLEYYLKEIFSEIANVDSICSRAKSSERFKAKSEKLIEGGKRKYDDPLTQIQDQIGARINVFYLSDVELAKNHVKKYLRFIEVQEKAPREEAEFGYFGTHFIVKVPDDVVPDIYADRNLPEFFELQIKTLFQHAWSEAHHDLGYKSTRPWTSEERRKMAFTSAQAWGADMIFDQLAQTLGESNDNG